jgi:chemosensory pili system protein ChpA (sensor histidine kinase/response regulator)
MSRKGFFGTGPQPGFIDPFGPLGALSSADPSATADLPDSFGTLDSFDISAGPDSGGQSKNRKMGQELLFGFAAEAKGYLPEILRGIADFRQNPDQVGRIEASHRYAHTIKGAAAMIGLMTLSELAAQLEESFEGFAAGRQSLTDEAMGLLIEVVTMIGMYLESATQGRLDDPSALTEASQLLRGLSLVTGEGAAAAAPPPPILRDSPTGEEKATKGMAGEPAAPIDSETSAELLEVFLPEAEEHLRAISLALPALTEQPNNRELLQEIRRSAHSLKGSAGVVGFHEMSRLAHRMEDLLDLLYEQELSVTPERLELLFASTDALEDLTTAQIDRKSLSALYETYAQVLDGHARGGGSERPPVSWPPPERPAPEESGSYPEAASRALERVGGPDPVVQSALEAMSQRRGQYVRVPIEQLDEVVKLVTELIITRASFEQNLTEFSRQLEELRSSATRLGRISSKMEVQYEASSLGRGLALTGPERGGVAAAAPYAPALVTANTHGFDDLEFDRYTEFHLLLRGLTEVSEDVETLDRDLNVIRDHFNTCLNRQGRLSSEAQDKVMRLRMVPLSTLSSRLQRAVRTVAAQRGKSVRLLIEGAETQLDKTLIEEMADPLLHLLRNAVDHGIEPPAIRRAQGKPPTGVIRLQALYEGTQITIRISDDGAGIDPERLRVEAIKNGYLSGADAARVPVEDLFSLIFMPGFTTAPEVSEISGRGVGLDVARVAIHRLKGSVKVESQLDEGTTFIIRLPMTLAVMRALMVKAAHETFAIPLVGVKQVIKVSMDKVDRVGKDPVARFGGAIYPLLSLAKLLNLKQSEEPRGGSQPALLLQLDDRQVAILVDETLGGREIVVKNMGNHLRHVRGVTGTTLTGNGSVVLILNMAELVQDVFRPRAQSGTPLTRPAAVSRRALTVMVVDDSLSVRRVLSNLITSAGWKPALAKDGLDALEILPRLPAAPDVVLLDIEMPRMDGYEFISALRSQRAYHETPVVVLTSRAGQKHRDKAFELGATDYLVKPYQDEALLSLIRRLTHRKEGAARR